ncbi:S-layer homology domain-containing protein [Paenibacillus sp. WQ 127069]|uniref:S-layer homology domain-containing protein n=1 Tax=Paenibacillus baimaensis TaxID=2982185 RepID=A0ABT2UU04_9BACL|nr:S-layer homology domain-containing protein [Paenibacillus sp. WQ 127069]MCU6797169.1 S-layer homology domain-containing protein [Paenibacillus sp. WQ 127069]
MALGDIKRSWKKRLSAMLVFTMAAGGFSSIVAPREAEADPGPTLPAWAGNAQFWLKADEGVTTATYGANLGVERWDNQAGTVSFDTYGGPVYKAAGANFNPVVAFANTGNRTAGLTQYLKGNTTITYADAYAVFKGQGTIVGSVNKMTNYGAAVFGSESNAHYVGNGTNSTYRNFPFNGSVATQRFHMTELGISGGSYIGNLDGEGKTFTGSALVPFNFNPQIGGTADGGRSDNWQNYNGELAEVIVFSGSTAADRNQIESYLALKYGLTLNNGGTSYVNSQNQKVWDSVANSIYKNRITGIGRDTGSTLNQRQSVSQNAGALVTLAAGNAIQASNQSNALSNLDNGDFLIFGDNGDSNSTAYQTSVSGTDMKRMNRVFQTVKTGFTTSKPITLQLDASAPAGATHLLVSSSGTFDSTSVKYALTGNKVTISSNELSATSYFTFAQAAAVTKTPGGVTNGLALWLDPATIDATIADGGSVAEWKDSSVNNNHGVQNTADNRPLYFNNATNNVNFNPIAKFDGDKSYLDLDGSKLPQGQTPRTIIAVGQTAAADANKYMISWGTGNYNQMMGMMQLGSKGALSGYGAPYASADGFWSPGIPNELFGMWEGNSGGNLASLYSKMKLLDSSSMTTWNTTGSSARIGAIVGSLSESWQGAIGDILVYNRALDESERQRISTYLALKYGYMIDQSQGPLSRYIASDGTSIVWDATANSAYKNNIAGIGRDDAGALNQRQSHSTNSGQQVTIGLNAIAATNSANAAAFPADKQYIIWGDNGKSLTSFGQTIQIAGSTPLNPAERIWKVQNTNNVGAVQLKIAKNAFADGTQASDIKLLAGNDESFATAAAIAVQESGGDFVANNVTLPNNGYFTFAQAVTATKAPGGVNGASLWLKADKDATDNGVGQLSGWTDQTGTNQFTVNGAPAYRTGAVNFNPAITIQNTATAKQNPNQYLIGDKSITYTEGYAVFKQQNGAIVGSAAPVAGGYGVGIFTKWGSKQYIGNGANSTYRGFSFNDTSRYYMSSFDAAAPIAAQGRLNGTPQTVTGKNTFNKINFTPVIGGTFGGGNPNNWDHYKGDIAEIVLFPASNTALQKQQVESYLALKYGLTLNNGNTDYVTSGGSDTMWTVGSNAGYGKRITGIGRDDGSDLLQKQSKSQEKDALVTIALGNTIEPANSLNANTIDTDMSFFAFSDNGAAAKYEGTVQEAPGHELKMLNRVFKVEKTKWQDKNITLKLDTVTENPAVLYYLIIDGVKTDMTLDGSGQVTINSNMLNNGSTFTFAKVYKDALKTNITKAKGLTAASYTPDSWAVLQNALDNAEAVLNNAASTQAQVDAALAALEAAWAGLSAGADKVQAKADEIQNGITRGNLKPGDYTTDSWNALTGALNDARALLARSPQATANELGQGLSKLEAARVSLVDMSQLRAKEAEITGENLKPANYTTDSWQALQQALTDARAVLAKPNATQAEVDAAKSALEAARAALVPAADKTALQAKMTAVKGLKEADYTPASWAVLQQALDGAENVMNNPNATQAEIDTAKEALEAALAGLSSSLPQLQSAVSAIQNDIDLGALKPGDYTADSWLALSGALDESKALLSRTPQASENEIGQALSKLATARNALVDLAPLRAKAAAAASVTAAVYTPASWQALQIVLNNANAILVKPGATQAEVDAAKSALEAAMEALVPVAGLTSLTPSSSNNLVPAFDRNILAYTMNVPFGQHELAWTPVAIAPGSKIEVSVNGGPFTTITSGDKTANYPLNVGLNSFIVKVTAPKGEVREYTINVTRLQASGSSSSGGASAPVQVGTDLGTKNRNAAPFATSTETASGTIVQVDPARLNELLKNTNNETLSVIVPNGGNVALKGLTADQVKAVTDNGSILEVGNLLAIYPVPGKALDLTQIARQYNNPALSEIEVNVGISRAPQALGDSARKAAQAQGYELLVDPVELDLTFSHKGQTVDPGLLNGYAPRYIALPEGIDPNRITTGVIVNLDGTIFHVPTVVTKINDRYFAMINDLRSNGTYSVIWNPQDFDDVRGHWGQDAVNDIAARLDLQGTGNNTFSPNRNVNRSEFAAIVAAGMGLMHQNVEAANFGDVSRTAWYHDSVKIASEFGIVEGFENGLFRGEDQITREQGIAMISRAFKLAQNLQPMTPAQIDATLAPFGDTVNVSFWAKEVVAQMIAAGIVEGGSGQLLNPQANLTRAEAAALMQRLLKHAGLID